MALNLSFPVASTTIGSPCILGWTWTPPKTDSLLLLGSTTLRSISEGSLPLSVP